MDPWVGKIPRRRKWQPTPVFLPGKSNGLRILVGYSPWGCKELDTTEQLHSLHYTIQMEKEMAPHFSILARRIPWTEELARLQSMRSQEADITERLSTYYTEKLDFPSGSDSKVSACNAGDQSLIPGLGRFPE